MIDEPIAALCCRSKVSTSPKIAVAGTPEASSNSSDRAACSGSASSEATLEVFAEVTTSSKKSLTEISLILWSVRWEVDTACTLIGLGRTPVEFLELLGPVDPCDHIVVRGDAFLLPVGIIGDPCLLFIRHGQLIGRGGFIGEVQPVPSFRSLLL